MTLKNFHIDKRKRASLQFLFLVLSGSCLTPIDEYSGYEIRGKLVISGQISPIEEMNIISITRTAERLPRPVTGASITLLDDQGNESLYSEDSENAGSYALKNVVGTPGTTYRIRVLLPEGKVYESVPEKMPETIGRDSIYYEINRERYTDADGIVANRHFLNIYADTHLPDATGPLFVKWYVHEIFALSPTDFPDPFNRIPATCYISQPADPQKILLFNSDEVRTTFVQNQLIISRLVDRSFKERHYFVTYQTVLTREAFEYWRKVDALANNVGSIFDTPPAKLKGNVFNVQDKNEEVHGYFQAVNQTYQRFFVLPNDLPFSLPLHCEYGSTRNYYDYPSECLDCMSARNSSYNRPPWF